MKIDEEKYIMPEMPYCPACPHGCVIYPEDATSIYDDCEWCFDLGAIVEDAQI